MLDMLRGDLDRAMALLHAADVLRAALVGLKARKAQMLVLEDLSRERDGRFARSHSATAHADRFRCSSLSRDVLNFPALSTQTPIVARRESAARRSSLRAPTISFEISTSAMSPSTIASASDTFWQHMPTAPIASWRFATSGHLCVLACGRTRTPRPFTASNSVR
jgi:hypothetical protein